MELALNTTHIEPEHFLDHLPRLVQTLRTSQVQLEGAGERSLDPTQYLLPHSKLRLWRWSRSPIYNGLGQHCLPCYHGAIQSSHHAYMANLVMLQMEQTKDSKEVERASTPNEEVNKDKLTKKASTEYAGSAHFSSSLTKRLKYWIDATNLRITRVGSYRRSRKLSESRTNRIRRE